MINLDTSRPVDRDGAFVLSLSIPELYSVVEVVWRTGDTDNQVAEVEHEAEDERYVRWWEGQEYTRFPLAPVVAGLTQANVALVRGDDSTWERTWSGGALDVNVRVALDAAEGRARGVVSRGSAVWSFTAWRPDILPVVTVDSTDVALPLLDLIRALGEASVLLDQTSSFTPFDG